MIIKLIKRPITAQTVSYGEFGKVNFDLNGEADIDEEIAINLLNSKYNSQFFHPEIKINEEGIIEDNNSETLPNDPVQSDLIKELNPTPSENEKKEEETEYDLKHLTLKQLKEAAKEAKLPEEEYISIATKKEMIDYLSPKLNG